MEDSEEWVRGGLSGGVTRGIVVRGVVKDAVLKCLGSFDQRKLFET